MNPRKSVFALLCAATMIGSCGKSVNTGKKLSTPLDSFSYMLGIRTGMTYKMEGLKELDYSSFAKGFEDGIKKDSGFVVPEKDASRVFQGYLQSLRSVAEKEAKAKADKWMESNKKKGKVEELACKGQFKVDKRGNGPVPTLEDSVILHFKVKDLKGTVLQNTESRGTPIVLPAKYIPIDCLREFVTKVPTGTIGTLYLPGPMQGFEATSIEEEFAVFVWEVNLIGMNPAPTILDKPTGKPTEPSAATE